MNGKRIFWIVVGVFIVFFIISSPADAAAMGRSLGNGVQHAFNQISQFIRDL
ncbi:MAG: hypothetical protein M3140_10155 [Actinomycetota bacterium]|nr:hypothetical protein [Actinomycetota bacterium]